MVTILKKKSKKSESDKSTVLIHPDSASDRSAKAKQHYVSPWITIVVVKLEGGLAATSAARVQIGSQDDSNTPAVEDWTTDGGQNQIYL